MFWSALLFLRSIIWVDTTSYLSMVKKAVGDKDVENHLKGKTLLIIKEFF